MPDPSTTRLALYKSKSDGSELVNYSQDIGQNWDTVDAAVGFQSCTSSTRPSSPYSGKPIFETDTSYRTYFSNGTSPASASWVEIPNGSASFNSTLRLASGKQININSSGSSASLAVVNATAGTDLISGRVTGDTQDRILIDTDGTLNWGPGNATTDTNLYRSAANTLRTADNLTVDLNLTVSGNITVSGIGQERYVLKPSDTARTSTTTVADDPHLTATVVANGVYFMRFVAFANTADTVNTDLKTAWNVPAGATGLKMTHGPTDTSAAFTSRQNTAGRFSGHGYTTTCNYQTDGNAIAVVEESVIAIGGTAGSVTFQWAQTASDTDAVTVLASSYLYIKRLA